MKVMHVMAGPKGGFFAPAVLALADAGIDQYITTRDTGDDELRHFEGFGIPVTLAEFPSYWRRKSFNILASAIERFRPDVIQYWTERAGSYAPRKFAPRSVAWFSDYYQRSEFRNCAWASAVTEGIQNHAKAQGGFSGRVQLTRPFAEPAPVAALDRRAAETPLDRPLAVSVTPFDQESGCEMLLDALAEVPGASLWLVGDGPLLPQLQTQCRLLGIDDRVRFLAGQNADAARAAADAIVTTGPDDTVGNPVMQAWAARRAIVAVAAPGPAELIRDGQNGLLTEPFSTHSLAEGLHKLLHTPALREQCVTGANKTHAELFTRDRFTTEILKLYKKVKAYGDRKIGAWNK